uniref:KH-like RNA-binding domain-containing protein n=1 Tax=Sus scrofa TaxID=9823 RepID=A0A4X1SEV6_PIG
NLDNMELRPWAVPDDVHGSFEVYIEEDQEELIFGTQDEDLHRIEVHSQTFIQLESGFPAGQTRVLIVGQLKSWLWLLCMILSITSEDPHTQARGGCQLCCGVRSTVKSPGSSCWGSAG